MREPFEQDSEAAAVYALGLVRGADRDAFAARLANDEGLRSLVEHWQRVLAVLDEDDAADTPAPPAGLFEKVLGRVEAEGLQRPGTKTRRSDDARWREITPGVHRRVLNVDRGANRMSVLVRMDPGATYMSHSHDILEEMLVLEGDLMLGDLRLSAGDHHLAMADTRHPVGSTVSGCLVHITRSLSDPEHVSQGR
ncbi:MAG: cupin domain-containing protein [Pseudomonadota bacterium]